MFASFVPSRRLLAALAACLVVYGFSPALAQEDPDELDAPVWSDLAPLAPQSLLLDAVTAGDRIIAVGDRGHVLLSDDGGSSWTQIRVPTRSMLTAVTSPDGKHVWAVGHDEVILHSPDGGRTWALQRFAPEETFPLLDVWFGDPEHGLAVGAYGLLLETRDGGLTWNDRRFDEEERHGNAIVQAVDDTLYIAGEFGFVFRSRDTGETWTALETPYHGSFFNALALPDGALLVFGLRGNLYQSTDGGDTWVSIPTETVSSLLGGSCFPDGTVRIVGLGGVVLTSHDGGSSFHTLTLPDRQALATVIPAGPTNTPLLLGEYGVRKKPELLQRTPKEAARGSDTR